MTCWRNESWDPYFSLILTLINHQLISLWAYISAEQAFFLPSIVSDKARNGGGRWSFSIELATGEGGDYDVKKAQKQNTATMASSWAAATQQEMAYGGLATACGGKVTVVTIIRGLKLLGLIYPTLTSVLLPSHRSARILATAHGHRINLIVPVNIDETS